MAEPALESVGFLFPLCSGHHLTPPVPRCFSTDDFLPKQSGLTSLCCRLTRSPPWGASPFQAVALRNGHQPLQLQYESTVCRKRRRMARAAFHRRHARWIWFKQVFQRWQCLIGLPVCSHPQVPICPAILCNLLNPLMLWDLTFVFDECRWTTETCSVSDLSNFPVVWLDFSNCVS